MLEYRVYVDGTDTASIANLGAATKGRGINVFAIKPDLKSAQRAAFDTYGLV